MSLQYSPETAINGRLKMKGRYETEANALEKNYNIQND